MKMPSYTVVAFIILNVISMYFYPGSNLNDLNQVGYRFSHNFFSDLGMTVTYSNVNNMISCILFNFSLCLVGFTFGMLFFSNRNLFPNFYYTSIFATIFGIVGAISFVGVAFTPSNLCIDSNGDPWLHVFFAHWIFRSISIISVLYSIMIFKTKNFDNKFAYGFIVFGLMVFAYVFYSEFYLEDPRTSPEFLVNHVLSQKMVVIWLVLSIYFYSIGLGKYLVNYNLNQND